jgi:hypothetical protein
MGVGEHQEARVVAVAVELTELEESLLEDELVSLPDDVEDEVVVSLVPVEVPVSAPLEEVEVVPWVAVAPEVDAVEATVALDAPKPPVAATRP